MQQSNSSYRLALAHAWKRGSNMQREAYQSPERDTVMGPSLSQWGLK
jgi:hypothetical protein